MDNTMSDNHKQLLHLENVYKQYDQKVILDDIDLSVSQGEFLVVVGPSGCGKSTLLRLILGQEQQTRGDILFMGSPIGPSNTDRGIVYQKYSLFPNLTVLENVTLGKRLQLGMFSGKSAYNKIDEEAYEFLNRARLKEHAHKYPHELSGGMQQRVAIIQALIMRPKILLMDEPFGALDPETREEMQIFILEIWEQSDMTIFFVTHDLHEAVFLGTRLIVLSQFYKDGRGTTCNRGARVVFDYKIKDRVPSTEFKKTDQYAALIEKIRLEGFDPKHIQHVTEFNLSHPDSFQTLEDIEKKL